jgi:5'-deoxynucleotidase
MKYINRWGLMRNSISENIQEHSLQVAIIAHALALIKNRFYDGEVDADHIAVKAIFHDASEILIGDLPTPVKYYNPEIKSAYKDVEDISRDKLISLLPPDLQGAYSDFIYEDEENEEYRIIKAADRISALIKCIEEEKVGNSEFRKASQSIKAIIDELIESDEMPEVKYFMDNFLDGFSLTLDELN